MNIILTQSEYFFQCHISRTSGDYKPALDALRAELYEYRKVSHKVIFLQEVMRLTKREFDEHFEECEQRKKGDRVLEILFMRTCYFFLPTSWMT